MNWREWPVQVIPTLFWLVVLLLGTACISWELALSALLGILIIVFMYWLIGWSTDPHPTTIGQWLKRRKERRDD